MRQQGQSTPPSGGVRSRLCSSSSSILVAVVLSIETPIRHIMNVFILQGNEFVSEAYRKLENATAPTTGPTVSSGFRTTETTVKVSTYRRAVRRKANLKSQTKKSQYRPKKAKNVPILWRFSGETWDMCAYLIFHMKNSCFSGAGFFTGAGIEPETFRLRVRRATAEPRSRLWPAAPRAAHIWREKSNFKFGVSLYLCRNFIVFILNLMYL